MKREELVHNLKVAYARLWVRLKGGYREPEWLVAELVIPVITLSAYVFLYKMVNAPPEYAGFVIIGGTMMAFWANVLWGMSAQFYWEKEVGNLEVYLVAPISRMAILLGMAIGGFVNTVLRAVAIFIAGILIFQVPIAIYEPLTALLIFFLTIGALYALGMMFASLFMLYGREAWHTASLLQEPIQFLSGTYFPTTSQVVPYMVQLLSSLIPLTFGLDGIRKVAILGQGISDVWLNIIALVVFIVVLLPLARLALNFMENLGKKEGRLTLRWQ
ncbi:MAG: ABC transporter permease [Candidatus Bathyarchaeota archaeon]|nr:ABC transporter permease [Candidatus Bathyarchaeota archaeon]MDH5788123.1 ABC transporter permease [Candidatus Bathyarchaeota archaeon]